MTVTRKAGPCLAGLLTGVPALLTGLFALDFHPIVGILITLAAMALLLSSLSELCQAHGNQELNLQGKQ